MATVSNEVIEAALAEAGVVEKAPVRPTPRKMTLRHRIQVIENFLTDHSPWTFFLNVGWICIGWPIYIYLVIDEVKNPKNAP